MDLSSPSAIRTWSPGRGVPIEPSRIHSPPTFPLSCAVSVSAWTSRISRARAPAGPPSSPGSGLPARRQDPRSLGGSPARAHGNNPLLVRLLARDVTSLPPNISSRRSARTGGRRETTLRPPRTQAGRKTWRAHLPHPRPRAPHTLPLPPPDPIQGLGALARRPERAGRAPPRHAGRPPPEVNPITVLSARASTPPPTAAAAHRPSPGPRRPSTSPSPRPGGHPPPPPPPRRPDHRRPRPQPELQPTPVNLPGAGDRSRPPAAPRHDRPHHPDPGPGDRHVPAAPAHPAEAPKPSATPAQLAKSPANPHTLAPSPRQTFTPGGPPAGHRSSSPSINLPEALPLIMDTSYRRPLSTGANLRPGLSSVPS